VLEAAILCLALNVYHESRGEPLKGQYAVAFVTLNRAKAWKKPICEIVYQPKQFSWTVMQTSPPNEPRAWATAVMVARAVTAGVPDFTNGSLYFHEANLKPSWRSRVKITLRIGNHVFYANS
jgi:spore germination cell wall hydrolase CwlJ-like protein